MNELRDSKGRTEEEFLAYYKTRTYSKPALTADLVVISTIDPKILLIRRGGHPFLRSWALPGGFANSDETIEGTAERELLEETSIHSNALKLVGIYSTPGRDPRGWVVSAAFLIRSDGNAQAGDDARDDTWFSIKSKARQVTLFSEKESIVINYKLEGSKPISEPCPSLAFDHNQIIIDALLAAKLLKD